MPPEINALLKPLEQYSDLIYFYFPLGIVGLWRWSVWILKKVVGVSYRAKKGFHWESVSVVTPVYNENPEVFQKALKSWEDNNPQEIIAIIDSSDAKCIEVFKEFALKSSSSKLIITDEPGKRPALALGIKEAKSEIVALVDSDTIWNLGVKRHALSPFSNPKVAGVGTRQNVDNPKTLAQKIFDIQLDQRYFDEMPFLSVSSDVLTCLSGRTAFYRRKVLLPLLDDLVNETFWGKKVISGEDKRLTYLIGERGFKLVFQSNARVYTPGVEGLRTLIKQRLRWSRNSWRADLRALFSGWAFKHPAFAFFLIDRAVQPFTVLLSPIYFTILLISRSFEGALVILVWWYFSRLIKISPHLLRRPRDILILPFYIIFNFAFGLLRIYALFTLNTQGWITRWDIKRLPKFAFFKPAPALVATTMTLLLLFSTLAVYKQSLFVSGLIGLEELSEPDINLPAVGFGGTEASSPPMAVYTVLPDESLSSIAGRFNIPEENIIKANIASLPNKSLIRSGQRLKVPILYPDVGIKSNYHTDMKNLPKSKITIDTKSDTIVVSGRGTHITLADIAFSTGDNYLIQEAPKIWYLKANLLIQNGVNLNLDKGEVEWLKLESNSNKFVWLKTHNGVINIDGVKVTSWDETKADFDMDYSDGRSFVAAKYSSMLNIYNSELSYLGYKPPPVKEASTFGVSWKIPRGSFNKYLLTGEVKNSKFHHNYFGAYVYGARGMVFEGNELFENVKYGLDPHDDSSGLLVVDNKIHHNGSHGIILSKRCINNVIRDNLIYNNLKAGIMLHESSGQNLVEGNEIYGNFEGLVVYNSGQNLVYDNLITGNTNGVRINMASLGNTITGNRIENNQNFGLYLYSGAGGTKVYQNNFSKNGVALYIKTKDNYIGRNTISANRTGIYLKGEASNNQLDENIIFENSFYAILSKTAKGNKNFLTYGKVFR
ncbi:MAG: Glycosyl transferase family 2 [Candidatus Daviesbacteria bacterium GW2011_GWA2_42_7]|uniref:Glycosyl transferase family 2 n=1 Tax=Candidatus Daviesbacteria bacterium GW2011_GWA2_42_7 TaxID=1618425 RepID=A0A0G1B8L7_9BACT|nr:MAG: Glycosyl transferase family 2 [Candidatus Daviesbacteria bacterium GW2011_GWA2_42_7]OGE69663.1 MAG: hypothetical protein A3J21_03140 [Candidatus Daviesbacteria bacterium RIFCSPLOWO2_02_FULL_43_11]